MPSAPNATEAATAQQSLFKFLGLTPEKMQKVATNVYKAHKQALKDGILDWSEANYYLYALG